MVISNIRAKWSYLMLEQKGTICCQGKWDIVMGTLYNHYQGKWILTICYRSKMITQSDKLHGKYINC